MAGSVGGLQLRGALRFEDHGDKVFVVAREAGRGHGSGAPTDAMVYSVLTFRDGKISHYREFYDEATARATLEYTGARARTEPRTRSFMPRFAEACAETSSSTDCASRM